MYDMNINNHFFEKPLRRLQDNQPNQREPRVKITRYSQQIEKSLKQYGEDFAFNTAQPRHYSSPQEHLQYCANEPDPSLFPQRTNEVNHKDQVKRTNSPFSCNLIELDSKIQLDFLEPKQFLWARQLRELIDSGQFDVFQKQNGDCTPITGIQILSEKDTKILKKIIRTKGLYIIICYFKPQTREFRQYAYDSVKQIIEDLDQLSKNDYKKRANRYQKMIKKMLLDNFAKVWPDYREGIHIEKFFLAVHPKFQSLRCYVKFPELDLESNIQLLKFLLKKFVSFSQKYGIYLTMSLKNHSHQIRWIDQQNVTVYDPQFSKERNEKHPIKYPLISMIHFIDNYLKKENPSPFIIYMSTTKSLKRINLKKMSYRIIKQIKDQAKIKITQKLTSLNSIQNNTFEYAYSYMTAFQMIKFKQF